MSARPLNSTPLDRVPAPAGDASPPVTPMTANPTPCDDRYRLLFAYSPNAVFLTRPCGAIDDANDAACRMLGMSLEEIRQVGRLGIIPVDEAFAQALALREATGRNHAHLTYVRKDGTSFVGETTSVVIDPESPESPSFVIVRDVTEQKRVQEALRERNEYIETILENAPIGFAVNTVDDGVARFVSHRFEAIYGIPQGSLTSVDRYFELVFRDPVYREHVRRRMISDMASGDAARMHWDALPIQTASGERRHVTAINIPLLDRNLMVSTVQDVTDRVRAPSPHHRDG
jgi:PAS domain S-box-containing protein